MSLVPADLRYAKSHEWIRLEENGNATVGITDYAQSSLGDITYVQLPKPGAVIRAGEGFGVVESVKAASDLYAPVSGKVVAVNEALGSAPETLNTAPYEKGWLLKLELTNPAEVDGLLDADGYSGMVT